MVTKPINIEYNLLTENWIPVISLTNEKKEVNLIDLFKLAPNLDGIYETSPEFEFGLYRFAIALIMDFAGIQTEDDILDLLEEGQFREDFFQSLHSISHRLNLFDEKYPFYQAVPENIPPRKKLKSVANLFHQLPSGTNPIFFNHSYQRLSGVSAKMCARALCSLPCFTTSGGAGFSPGVNGSPPIYELIRGKNLFQTLLLNVYTGEHTFPDVPIEIPWKTEHPMEMKVEKSVGSFLHGFVWQPRYCKLIPESNKGKCSFTNEENQILVKKMIFNPGWKLVDEGNNWKDPNVAYRTTKKGIYPMRFQEGRDFWRDYGPFMCLTNKIYENKKKKIKYDRPLVISQLRNILSELDLNKKRITLSLYTLDSDKAKIKNWRRGILSLPSNIVFSEIASEHIQKIMDMTESIEYALSTALKHLFPRDCKGNTDGFLRIREQASTQLWSRLFPLFENYVIQELEKDPDSMIMIKEVRKNWGTHLFNTCKEILEEILDGFDGSAEFIKKGQEVRDIFFPRMQSIKNKLKNV